MKHNRKSDEDARSQRQEGSPTDDGHLRLGLLQQVAQVVQQRLPRPLRKQVKLVQDLQDSNEAQVASSDSSQEDDETGWLAGSLTKKTGRLTNLPCARASCRNMRFSLKETRPSAFSRSTSFSCEICSAISLHAHATHTSGTQDQHANEDTWPKTPN